MISNIIKNKSAIKSFEEEINNQRQDWEEEEAERAEKAQEAAIAEALREDPNINPNDVPIQAVVPRIFLCQQTMERCLNKMVADILPTDAVLQQEQYMKNTKKPKKMSAKQWINRLEVMREALYWMGSTNYRMEKRTFNQECIARDLPIEWKIEFERSDTSTKIRRTHNKTTTKNTGNHRATRANRNSRGNEAGNRNNPKQKRKRPTTRQQ